MFCQSFFVAHAQKHKNAAQEKLNRKILFTLFLQF